MVDIMLNSRLFFSSGFHMTLFKANVPLFVHAGEGIPENVSDASY